MLCSQKNVRVLLLQIPKNLACLKVGLTKPQRLIMMTLGFTSGPLDSPKGSRLCCTSGKTKKTLSKPRETSGTSIRITILGVKCLFISGEMPLEKEKKHLWARTQELLIRAMPNLLCQPGNMRRNVSSVSTGCWIYGTRLIKSPWVGIQLDMTLILAAKYPRNLSGTAPLGLAPQSLTWNPTERSMRIIRKWCASWIPGWCLQIWKLIWVGTRWHVPSSKMLVKHGGVCPLVINQWERDN